MRYLAIILLFSIGNLRAQSDTTKYFTSNDYGWKYKRVYTPLVLAPPQDTLYGKWGIAQKGSSLFVGNGTKWTLISGGGGGGSTDTTSLSNRINLKLNISDTAAMLANYLGSGTDISVKSVQVTGTNSNGHIGLRHQTSNPTSQGQTSTLFAASDGRLKYKNDGNPVSDIATMDDLTGFATTSSVNSALGLKVNISDTGAMLNGYLRKADTIRYATALNSKLNISDTLAMLDGRLSSITLNTTGAIHNNPITFSRLGGAWSGTMSLANQSANTIFRRGSGTGAPSFGSIDSSYFGNLFKTQVLGCAAGSNGQVQFNSSGSFGADASFTYAPSVTASGVSGVATATTLTPILIANANTQTLSGLTIAPNFTTTSNTLYYALRTVGSVEVVGNSFNVINISSPKRTSALSVNSQGFSGTVHLSSYSNNAGEIQTSNGTSAISMYINRQGGRVLINTISDDNASQLQVNGNLALRTAGNKINIATGTNASVGTATLIGGTVTVNTTAVTANSIILLTHQNCTNCGTPYVNGRVAGTSFTIASTNVLDASTIAYQIIN